MQLSEYQKEHTIARINRTIKAFKQAERRIVQQMLAEDRFQCPTPEERDFLKHCEETIIYLLGFKQKLRQDRVPDTPSHIQMVFEFKR